VVVLPTVSTIGVDEVGSSWSVVVVPEAASVNTVPLASRVYVVDGVVPQTDGGVGVDARAHVVVGQTVSVLVIGLVGDRPRGAADADRPASAAVLVREPASDIACDRGVLAGGAAVTNDVIIAIQSPHEVCDLGGSQVVVGALETGVVVCDGPVQLIAGVRLFPLA
jgi:hypothetical protein